MSQDVMICVMNSTSIFDDVNVKMQSSESYVKCVYLDAELLNKQNEYNALLKRYSQVEKHCISLELTMQLNQEIFQKESFTNNQNAFKIPEYFENNDLKAQLQAKDTTICKLKEHIKSMRENDKEEKVKHEIDEIETINIELEHSVAKLLSENKRLHKEIEQLKKIYKDQFDLIKKTRALSKEHDDSLIAQLNSKSMENANLKRKEVENASQIPIATTVAPGMFKLDLDPLAPRKNKVEAQPRKVNKKNHVKEPICDDNVKHTILNANSQLICVKCKQCMFDANHDVYFLEFVNDVNMHAKSKSKSKKSKVQNIWKPTGKVFTDVGLKWKPTGRLFTIIGNSCHLTRFTPNKIVPLKETTYNSVETPKPKIKVYSRRPKQIKSVGSSKKDKIVESKIANNSKPNHLFGSNATDVPSSSSLINDRLSRLFSGIETPDLAKDGLARGIPKLKFQKDHLCSACVLEKSKKSSHQPNAEDTNQEKLYLLHMDLCGSMRVDSINGKNNRTEFFNQTLRDFYENVSISHQTSVTHTPQKNGVVERRNRTLMEGARTMLMWKTNRGVE
ncbi:retrovirus-related pol polyprotein from transposon TNT 1-94 [Tanacetum coccineum]